VQLSQATSSIPIIAAVIAEHSATERAIVPMKEGQTAA
jgi:hypothetical protein